MTLAWSRWWIGAAVALLAATAAGLGERRRRRRADLDRVPLIDWVTAQMVALLAAAVCAGFALLG